MKNQITKRITSILLWFIFVVIFTTNALAQSPGGVSTNLNLWLKADAGITESSGDVSEWASQVGSITATTAADFPTLSSNAMNFNPAVNFADNEMVLSNVAELPSGNSPRTFIAVVTNPNPPALGTWRFILGYGGSPYSYDDFSLFGIKSSTDPYFDPGYRYYTATGLTVDANPSIVSFAYASRTGYMYANGVMATNSPYSTTFPVDFTTGTDVGYLGNHAQKATYDYPWNGNIAEVIAYSSDLHGTNDLKKVESYLAVKYGLTKAGDYMAANGTVIWDATANSTYHNRITAIGVQATSHFVQAKSLSEHEGILTIEGNPSNFADGSYLVVGDNNATLDYGNTAGSYDHINRIWKVAKTGTIGAVTLDIGSNISGAQYLLVSSSTDFSAATKYDLTSGQTSVTLNDGEFFTFAKDGATPPSTSPGGVANNITLWLKADAGTNTTTNGADVTQWDCELGTITATSAADNPTYVADAINFNPAVNFAGNEMVLNNIGGLPSGNSPRTFIAVVTKSTPVGLEFILGYSSVPYAIDEFNLLGVSGTAPYFDPGYRYYTATGLTADANPSIVSFAYDASANRYGYLYANGTMANNSPYNATFLADFNTGTDVGYLGNHAQMGSYDFPWNGNIAEVIAYSSDLHGTADLTKIETYLALKYGISRAGDYVSSGGTTIWDAGANSAYANRITAIGQDDASELDQIASLSIASGAVLTVDGGSSLGNGNFLIVGDNGATLDFGNTAGSYDHINRIWKVAETGTVGAVTLDIGSNITGATYLLVDSDGDFTSGATKYDLSSGSVSVDLADGQYFTFAKDGATPVTTAPGNALTLDGVDDYVELNGLTPALTWTSSMTWEAWFKTSNVPGTWANIIGAETADASAPRMRLMVGNSGLFADYFVNGSNEAILNATADVVDNRWHHAAVVNNMTSTTAGTLELYLDGDLVATTNYTFDTEFSTTQPVYIGKTDFTSPYLFKGEIDEVRVWQSARTEQDLRDNMYIEIADPSSEADLVAYYGFDETSGTTAADQKGSYDGTLHNMDGTEWSESYALVAPPALVATAITSSGFTANWSTPATGATELTGYYLDVATAANSDFGTMVVEKQDVTGASSFAVTGLDPATDYVYRIRAYKTSTGDVGALHYYNPIPVTTSAASGTAPGNALSFDGVDDEVVIPNATELENYSNITVEAWVKPTGFPQQYCEIVSKTATSADGYELYYDDVNKQIGFELYGIGSIVLNYELQPNNYYHLAFTYDGSFIRSYINGLFWYEIAATGAPTTNTTPVVIGNYGTGSDYNFEGEIDEVRIWNTARTEAQIQANLYNELSNPAAEANLAAYYEFNEASGTTLYDGKGNNDGTLQGATGGLPQPTESFAMVASSTQAATNITTNSFTANWSAPQNGTPTGYRVIYTDQVVYETGFVNPMSKDVSAPDLSTTITGLNPGRTYYYYVVPLNSDLSAVGAWRYDENEYEYVTVETQNTTAPGNALTLDGVDDYVELSGLTPALTWTSSMTWEAWFKTSNIPGTWANIIGAETADASAPRMRLMVGNSGLFADYFVNGSNEAILNATADVVDNRWHHAAVVNNMSSNTAGTLELYLDGDLIATKNYTFDTEFSTTQPVYIGKTDYTSPYLFKGEIDEVRVWQSARTEQDIRDNMYIEIADPSSEADLVAYYGFSATSGTTAADRKGSYYGTLHNMDGTEWSESYALVAPPALVATAITSSGFTANWSAPATGATELTGYYLDVATAANSDFGTMVVEKQNVTGATSFAVTGLDPATDYIYRIRAYKTSTGDVGALHYYNPIPVTTQALQKYTTTFTVSEGATPVTGAVVDINGSSLTTDGSGQVTIDLPDGSYPYTVNKTGYHEAGGTLVVSGGVVGEIVSLTPSTAPTYTSTFTVTDGTNPIVGAVVGINGSSLTTNGSGEVTIDLPDGSYPYTVDKTGYNQGSGTLVVSGGVVGEAVSLTPATGGAVTITGDFTVGVDAPYPFLDGAVITVSSTGNLIIPDGKSMGIAELIIEGNGTVTVENGGAMDVSTSVTVENGGSLFINGGGTADIGGDLTVETGGTIECKTGTGVPTGSLICNGSVINSGTMSISKTYTPIHNYVASPIAAASITNFDYTSGGTWELNDATGVWEPATPVSGNMEVGKGYYTVHSAEATVTYSGTFNTGAQTLATTALSRRLEVAGNPYTSALDWEATGWTKTNIYDVVWYRTTDNQNAVWNGITKVGINGGTSVIPAMTGFSVKTNASGSGVLQVTADAQVHEGSSLAKSGTYVADMVRLQMSSNTEKDETVVLMRNDATAYFEDGLDAEKLFDVFANEIPNGYVESSVIYSLSADKVATAINSLNYSDNAQVDIAFRATKDGEYTIAATEINFGSDISVYLEDKFTGKMTNLRKSVYTFSGSMADSEERFILHLNNSTTAIDNFGAEAVKVYAFAQSVYVNLPSNQADVTIYDITGRTLINRSLTTSGLSRIDMNTAAGTYIVKVISQEGVTTQKIIIE